MRRAAQALGRVDLEGRRGDPLFAALIRTGTPRSAFLAVIVKTPAAAAGSRLVIPSLSRRVFTRSGYSTTYMLAPSR